jgi:hypothetical protein
LQQEIAEASDDAAKNYYDETPKEDRSDEGVTTAMRSAAKSKQQSFKGQFSKYLAIANPKFGDKCLDEVSAFLHSRHLRLHISRLDGLSSGIQACILDRQSTFLQRESLKGTLMLG